MHHDVQINNSKHILSRELGIWFHIISLYKLRLFSFCVIIMILNSQSDLVNCVELYLDGVINK